MKKTLIAGLASLMLAGILAGASEPAARAGSSAVSALAGTYTPVMVNAPIETSYGDSTSH